MHSSYENIVDQLLIGATDAINFANTHATYFAPGKEHSGTGSVLEAARAGELLLKAVIAKHHPLLIFKDIFNFDKGLKVEITEEDLISSAKTHDFQHLPKIFWVVAKERVPDQSSFQEVRQMRNALQHFFHAETGKRFASDARDLTFRFLYRNVDPLLKKHFGKFCIEYVDDDGAGYDYVVAQLLRRSQRFSIPENFTIGEICVSKEIALAEASYKVWFSEEMNRIGQAELYSFSD